MLPAGHQKQLEGWDNISRTNRVPKHTSNNGSKEMPVFFSTTLQPTSPTMLEFRKQAEFDTVSNGDEPAHAKENESI